MLTIRIHVRAWRAIEHSKELRTRMRKLAALIAQEINDRSRHSDSVRYLGEQFWKRRLVGSQRVTYSYETSSENLRITFWEVLSHKEGDAAHVAYRRPSEEVFVAREEPETVPQPRGLESWEAIFKTASEKDLVRLEDDLADLQWALDDEQAQFVWARGPVVLTGHAGTGKSTLATYRLLSSEFQDRRVAFVTYTRQLCEHARLQHRQLGGGDAGVVFLTFADLARQLIPDAATRFPHDSEVGYPWFSTLGIFKTIRLDPVSVWEEIRGLLRGDKRILAIKDRNPGRMQLTDQEYLDLPLHRSFYSEPENRHSVLAILRKYQEEKRLAGVWDDLDLTLAAWSSLDGQRISHFDELICDEVQDLTAVQLGLLANVVSGPDGFIVAGDADQAIHPSRFEWQRLQDVLYPLCRDEGGRSVKPRRLSRNYRSVSGVVNLSNRISQIRGFHTNSNHHTNTAIRDGNMPWFIELEHMKSVLTSTRRRLNSQVLVVTPDKASCNEAAALFGSARCMTVHEAKGLERSIVILYGFLSIQDRNWRLLLDDGEACGSVKNSPNPARGYLTSEQECELQWSNPTLRYLLNALNVAVTRASDYLFILGDTRPTGPIFRDTLSDEPLPPLQKLLFRKQTPEELLASAKSLELEKLYTHAAAEYEAAGSPSNAQRCQGLHFMEQRLFAQAAQAFSAACAWPQADEAWQQAIKSQASLLERGIETLLDSSRRNTNPALLEQWLREARARSLHPPDLLRRLSDMAGRVPEEERTAILQLVTGTIASRTQSLSQRAGAAVKRCSELLKQVDGQKSQTMLGGHFRA